MFFEYTAIISTRSVGLTGFNFENFEDAGINTDANATLSINLTADRTIIHAASFLRATSRFRENDICWWNRFARSRTMLMFVRKLFTSSIFSFDMNFPSRSQSKVSVPIGLNS